MYRICKKIKVPVCPYPPGAAKNTPEYDIRVQAKEEATTGGGARQKGETNKERAESKPWGKTPRGPPKPADKERGRSDRRDGDKTEDDKTRNKGEKKDQLRGWPRTARW